MSLSAFDPTDFDRAYDAMKFREPPRYYLLSFIAPIDTPKGAWLVQDGDPTMHYLALEDCKAGERGSYAICSSPPVWKEGRLDGKPFSYLDGMEYLYEGLEPCPAP